MSRDKKEETGKTGASPRWAVRIFPVSSDAVAGHESLPQ